MIRDPEMYAMRPNIAAASGCTVVTGGVVGGVVGEGGRVTTRPEWGEVSVVKRTLTATARATMTSAVADATILTRSR
jgi:hypothetical protein